MPLRYAFVAGRGLYYFAVCQYATSSSPSRGAYYVVDVAVALSVSLPLRFYRCCCQCVSVMHMPPLLVMVADTLSLYVVSLYVRSSSCRVMPPMLVALCQVAVTVRYVADVIVVLCSSS
ncbi:hypothetical protein Dimus_036416, partial [Dionaea muscipula]